MKNTKTKGLLLGLAMVASVASVGYASWVISAGASDSANGNITAETVVDKSITLTAGTVSDIRYGITKADTLKNSFLKNSTTDKTGNLVANVTMTATNLSVGDTIEFKVEEDPSNSSAYAKALEEGVVGNLPTLTLTVTSTPSKTNEATLTKSLGNCDCNPIALTYEQSSNTYSVSNVNVPLTFTWGKAFGTDPTIPEDFYASHTSKDEKINSGDPGYKAGTVENYGQHANHYLGEAAKLEGKKFVVKITATAA